MRRPNEVDSTGRSLIVRLKKPIYGLKQSSRILIDKINNFFVSTCFTRPKAEPWLYTTGRGRQQIVVGVYVDDVIIAGTLNILLICKMRLPTRMNPPASCPIGRLLVLYYMLRKQCDWMAVMPSRV